jgi:hypothetical protein
MCVLNDATTEKQSLDLLQKYLQSFLKKKKHKGAQPTGS